MDLFMSDTNPPSKICGNAFRSFCVILTTNQPTDQTAIGEDITSLVEARIEFPH